MEAGGSCSADQQSYGIRGILWVVNKASVSVFKQRGPERGASTGLWPHGVFWLSGLFPKLPQHGRADGTPGGYLAQPHFTDGETQAQRGKGSR